MTPRFLCFLLVVLALCGSGGSCYTSRHDEKVQPGSIHLHGAGATFPAPLYATWLAEYHKRHPEIHLRYDAVGSGAGILRFMAWAVDFRASDAAMTDGDMAQVSRGVQLIPVVAGSIVLAYHLPGVRGISSSHVQSTSISCLARSPSGTIHVSRRRTPISPSRA